MLIGLKARGEGGIATVVVERVGERWYAAARSAVTALLTELNPDKLKHWSLI